MAESKLFERLGKKMETAAEPQSEVAVSGEPEGWSQNLDGQLAVDVYQTDAAVVIKAPVAGVKPADIHISITDDVVTIQGTRKQDDEVAREDYFAQECYWGSFSRSIILPLAVETEKASASFSNGVLTLKIPKAEKSKTKIVKVVAQ